MANKGQHAFLELPGQVWETEIISMKFRQNKVFPPEGAWISIERDIIHANANVINCDQSDYIITGGPVKLLAWYPNVSDNRQILAISISHQYFIRVINVLYMQRIMFISSISTINYNIRITENSASV